MANTEKQGFNTKAVHAGTEPEPVTGAIMTPVFFTSTYVQPAPAEHRGYEYSRTGNPTRTALATAIAALEGAEHGLCFASGMSAVSPKRVDGPSALVGPQLVNLAGVLTSWNWLRAHAQNQPSAPHR